MRTRIIYDKNGDKIAEYRNGEYVWGSQTVKVTTHHVMPDIQPYQSMKTGEMITSREQHREHLARYSLVEIGNDTSYFKPKPPAPDPELKEIIRTQIDSMTHDQFRKAIRSDLEFARWNSRGRDGAG